MKRKLCKVVPHRWPSLVLGRESDVIMVACVLLRMCKLRLQYKGAPKYLRESVTTTEIGLRKR